MASMMGQLTKVRRPFQHFVRQEQLKQHQSFKELGKRWRALPDSEKAKYKNMYLVELRSKQMTAKDNGFGLQTCMSKPVHAPQSFETSLLQLGPYVLESSVASSGAIGKGTYGVVLVMQHVNTRRRCAVKLIRDSRLFESLAVEVSFLKMLKHESLLPPLDHSLEGPMRWAAFQLITDGNLDKFVKQTGSIGRTNFFLQLLINSLMWCSM
jgi:hypothetical protein